VGTLRRRAAKRAGFEFALGLSKHPHHGYGGLVERFAKHVGGKTYLDLFENTNDLRKLGKNILTGMRKSDRIHFNLDGMIRPGHALQDVVELGKLGIGHMNVTNWELHMTLKKFSRKATFYLNGRPVDIRRLL
jgi:hypothetical protein